MLDLGKISALFAQRKLGHALPQALYNDPDVFEFDMLAIYGQSWLLVGLECELPKAGATLAMNIGPWPSSSCAGVTAP
jgi:Rieske 2Fe-2S family protein